jgi:hypothetical protein
MLPPIIPIVTPLRTLTLGFHSFRMEEHTGYGSDWSESRHFRSSHDVYLTSGMLELETGEVLGDGRLERSTITADLTFCLTSTEPAESAMRYWPFIGDDHGGIGPFITFDIIASRSRFRELVTNVRHGLVPENISIKLAEDEKFWRSVDPTSKWSRKIWQNEIDDTLDCAAIPIENYAFSYLIKKAGVCIWTVYFSAFWLRENPASGQFQQYVSLTRRR